MRSLLILPALFCFSILPLGAAVTPERIAEKLESPEGITWQADGPDADSWRIIGHLHASVSSQIPGASRLTASLTGPGVISLNTAISGNATGRIWVDGVASGGFLGAIVRDRVQLGSGTHDVTWEFTPQAGASATVTVNGLEWIPGPSEAPLQSGANGTGVTLTGPWIGQTAFHHKDGAAAWSGIVLSAPEGEVQPAVELRGDFTGPGVFSYRTNGRDGEGRFKLDEGEWTGLGLGWTPSWARRFMRVGPGQHVARWAPVREVSDFRYSTDMVVDEVQIRPEVDIAVALETPARVWTAPPAGADQAFGMEMEDTPDGAGVILQGDAKISTPVTEGQVFRMRIRGDLRFVGGLEEALTVHQIEQEAETTDGQWRTVAIRVAQAGTMTIGSGGSAGGAVDKVEVVEMPADIASFLNLPGNTFSTGGAPWQVAMDETMGQYVLQSESSGEEPEAWVDIPVTGPAVVRIGFKVNSTGSQLRMLVDGKEAWDSSDYGWVVQHAQEVKIEIPAGVHAIRCQAKTSYPFEPVKLLGIEISPLAGGGMDGNAADDTIWAYSGGWERTDAVDHDGGGAIRPVAFTRYGGGMPVLRRLFSGPGTLRFHRYLEEDALFDSSTYWVMKDSLGYDVTDRATYSSYGWDGQERWYPEGGHWFEWSASRIDGAAPKLLLDGIGFTPSETVDFATAFGATGAVLANDTELPWTAVKKEAGDSVSVVSPLLEGGQSTGFSTTVTGPALVSFRWKTGHSGRVTGGFYVNDEPVSGTVSPDGTFFGWMIEQTGPVKLEWRAEGNGDWLEVKDFQWSAWQESTLASALDTAPDVTWSTSPTTPFTGRPHHQSQGGTAAQVSMEAGAETWLEATVEGPGFFDFWLRDVPNVIPWVTPGFAWNVEWELTVDGRKVALPYLTWPAVFVEGAGPHQIRLTVRNTSGVRFLGAVDQVSWVPLAPSVESGWTASDPGVPNTFSGGGKDGAPMVILPMEYIGRRWIEKTVTGPGLLVWDSKVVTNDAFFSNSNPQFTVNGEVVEASTIAATRNEWNRHRFSVPPGTHTLRWEMGDAGNDYSPENEVHGYDFASGWHVSGMTFTPGTDILAEALDEPSLGYLLVGREGRMSVNSGTQAWDGVDSVLLEEGWLYLCNPSQDILEVTTMWKRDNDPWMPVKEMVAGGEIHLLAVAMTFGFSTSSGEVGLDGLVATRHPMVSMAEALDTDLVLSSDSWLGVQSASSYDGVDNAWSALPRDVSEQKLAMTTSGPGRLGFRWRTDAGSLLRLVINGAVVPVVGADASWREVLVDVDEGDVIEWVHGWNAGGVTNPSHLSACVDTLSFEPRPAWDLGQAGGIPLESLGESNAWKPLAYRDWQGVEVSAARLTGGGSILSATVTGPAVVRFNARCYAVDTQPPGPPPPPGAPVKSSMVIIGGGGSGGGSGSTYQTIGNEITFGVGVIEKAWIPARGLSALAGYEVFIPAGSHQIWWRLSEVRRPLHPIGGSTQDYRVPFNGNLQAEVAGISVRTTRAVYGDWLAGRNIPQHLAGSQDDADGDGESNLQEFAQGSDPADAASRKGNLTGAVQPVSGRMVFPNLYPGATGFYDLYVPYVKEAAGGVLESSGDLVTWTPRPEALLPAKPSPSISPSGWPTDTDTHQVISIPVYPEEGNRYYRLRFSLSQ